MTSPPELPAESIEELFDNAPCGYVSASLDGAILRVNATLLRWLGYTAEELVNKKRFQDLLNVVGRVYYDTHLEPHLSLQGEVGEVAFDLLCANGAAFPVLLHVRRQKDRDGAPQLYRFTIFNARERRRYERDLLAARREAERANAALAQLNDTLEQRIAHEVNERLKAESALRQAQKMEALGQLTGGIAHDLNNQLTVVVGGLDTILRQLDAGPVSPETARQRRAAQMAMQGARAAAALTHRLLSFSRQQPLHPKRVDINRCVAGMSELLHRTLGEGVVLETVLAAGLWHAKIDSNQLENALLNLAVNARDAMGAGGQLTIETSNAHLDDQYVSQLALRIPAGQYVCIAVTDTGAGMDADTLERVFEPFFTTKEPGKGTGLGLSQVYGFVRQSGGNVKIYSEPGRGTTVRIYLPRHEGKEASEPSADPAPLETGRGECVLLVEDDDLVRDHSRQALEELDYRVLEANDSQSALNVLSLHGEVSLLFTDLMLPGGMTGAQLAERARMLRPDLKVLFTTGYSRDAVLQQRPFPEGVSFISKPFMISDLARELRRVLQ